MSRSARRSLSMSSPDAEYHTIPQPPVASTVALLPTSSSAEDDGLSSSDEVEEEEDVSLVSPVIVDGRIRTIHFILGSAVLLPWNVMITATPYFISRLAGSSVQSSFSSYLSLAFTASNFGFLAYAVLTLKQSDSSRRTLFSTLLLALLVFLLTLSTYVHLPPGFFFAFVLLNGITQAGAGSFLQTSVMALAAFFGPSAMQAVMSGQAAVGVVVSGVQVLSAIGSINTSLAPAAEPTDGRAEEKSAFAFFGLSTLFLLSSIGAHAWLLTMPAYKATVVPYQQRTKGFGAHIESAEPNERQGLVSGGLSGSMESGMERAIRVAKANVVYEIAVAYVFTVTLAVFPPITASVRPTNPDAHPLLFTAVHFLVFNIGDFSGRYICSFPRLLIWSAKRLLTLSLLRTLFIPVFLLCNIARPSSSLPLPSPVINSDILFMLILLLFGMSNGYTSSLCMMSVASLTHNPRLRGRREDVDVAATVASFCLVGGLTLGSIASFAVRAAVCGCNPFVT